MLFRSGPRCCHSVRVEEHGFFCLGVVIPFVEGSHIAVSYTHLEYLFTSESVSEGHPDKVADQISDAILDAILEQDPTARVAAETLCTTGTVMLAGEISTTANVDYTKIVRDTLKRIGYDDSSYGIDHKGCAVLVAYDKQSPDIAQGVDKAQDRCV